MAGEEIDVQTLLHCIKSCLLEGELVAGRREHNHPADPEVYAAKQARARLREGLEETGGSVAEAVHQVSWKNT